MAMLAITAASAANSIVQQSKAAAAQDEFNQKQREASIKAMNDNMSQIELAKQQATEQAGQKTFENDIAARKAMATAKVSAGESGVAGLSVDALLAELDGSRARYNQSVQANLDDTINNLNSQRTNINNSAASQVNYLRTPQAPDYIGAGLRIGSAYANYESETAKAQETAKLNAASK